jgi:hypothetical protein
LETKFTVSIPDPGSESATMDDCLGLGFHEKSLKNAIFFASNNVLYMMEGM